MVNDSADVASSGRSFHICGPAIGKARLPTVDSLLIGTTRRLVPTERSDCRLGRSATRVKGPRYTPAQVRGRLFMSIRRSRFSQGRASIHFSYVLHQ